MLIERPPPLQCIDLHYATQVALRGIFLQLVEERVPQDL